MSTIVVQALITLGGVVQSGGGPDEDRDGGFEHGGWESGCDEQMDHRGEMAAIVAEWESRIEALLLGRRTYEIFANSWAVWNENADGLPGDLTRRYNRIAKYVASRTLSDVRRQNAELLGPDVPAAVASLRAEPGGEIREWGSTKLVRTLAKHDLVDEYRLPVYPLVLGTGKKLFSDGFASNRLTLAESCPLESGVQVNTYRRSGATSLKPC
ncbi:MAG: dihydrofolate reductase family protein [Candidatus Nanopelagicales bacterium]